MKGICMTDEAIRQQDRGGNGCLIAVVSVIGLFLLIGLLNPKKETVDVRVMGQIKRPLLADESFELAVWHHHPGNLKYGQLTVRINGKTVPAGRPPKYHSFETWEPNEQHAVTISCPLVGYDPTEPLTIDVVVKAANARDTFGHFVWQGNGWKK
jgi:hypothetical protein